MIPFEKYSDALDIEPFISEEVAFNFMHFSKEAENPILMRSNSGKIIVIQASTNHPAWVWTENNLSDNDYKELSDGFYELFSERTILRVAAKPEISKFLADDYARRKNISWKTFLCMGSYYCPKIIPLDNINGSLCKASLADIDIITEFFVGFMQDCFGNATTIEKQVDTAKTYILSDNLYVWKIDDEIVSMANIAHRSSRYGRINEVYTPPLKRNKGYAGALVSELCNILYKEKRMPMLYTDLSNPVSNKAYKNVGFIECGSITQIRFIYE